MKRVVITGCSRGIGLGVLKKLLSDKKFEVIGTSTSGKHPIQTNNFKCFPLDLGNNNSIEAFAKRIQNMELDFLIKNAGILLEKWDNSNIDFQQMETTFRVNLFGTIRLTEYLIPRIRIKGHIINVTSDWGVI